MPVTLGAPKICFAITLILAFVAGDRAWAVTDLWRCHSADSVFLQDDGSLKKTEVDARYWEGMLANFIVDSSSGIIRLGVGATWHWTVVQEGSTGNDAVLAMMDSAASAAIIRVRGWNTPATFLYYDIGFVISGICEPLQ